MPTPNKSMKLKSKDAGVPCARFQKIDSFKADSNEERYGNENAVVDVPFGIVHLFRNLGESTDQHIHTLSNDSNVPDSDVGTVLAMLNVPSSFTTSEILSYISSALNTVQHLRLIQCVPQTNI